ncbi:MAG: Ig-like domain-containing protein [Planctomycetes bacterium]|nr:Ig-like domain-containing protein [Planctomycetota bacterium]
MSRLPAALLVSALVLSACSPDAEQPEPFRVVRVAPEDAAAAVLALNDSITVCFSADLAPTSVTEESCAVLDEAGLRVSGGLRVRGRHLTFSPRVPLAPDLSDGSFLPGHRYQMVLAGLPRPDGIRAVDGRRLSCGVVLDFTTAAPGHPQHAVLRSPLPGMPFLPVDPAGPQQLAVDRPLLQVRFTAPVAPWSVQTGAVQIRRYGNPVEVLMPRGVRLVRAARDELEGALLEVDLGGVLMDISGRRVRPLQVGDLLSLSLSQGTAALRDYGGVPVLPAGEPCWHVIPGAAVARMQWPGIPDAGLAGAATQPGFEVYAGAVMPRARLETGTGRHGSFVPQVDTSIASMQPFDRGDRVEVRSDEGRFEFLGIEIPAGVVVTVDATRGPVRLLAVGGVRIAGTLRILARALPLRLLRPGAPVEAALEMAPVAIAASGSIEIAGRIEVVDGVAPDATALCLASASGVDLSGPIPFHTLLAVAEAEDVPAVPAIRGARGQALVVAVSFQRGVPAGASWTAVAESPWLQVPMDLGSSRLHLVDAAPGCSVGWQTAPADPLRPSIPDLTKGRQSGIRIGLDGDALPFVPGEWVRFTLSAAVVSGSPLPSLRSVQVFER